MTNQASAFDAANDSMSAEPIFKWEKVRVAIQENLHPFPEPWALTDDDDPVVVRAMWGKFWNLNTSSNLRARGHNVDFYPSGFSFKLAPADLIPNSWDVETPEFYSIRAVHEGLGGRTSLVVSGMYPNDGSMGEIKYREVKVQSQSHKVTFQALIALAWDDADVTIDRMIDEGIIPPLLPNHEYNLIMDINPDDHDLEIPKGMVIYCHKMTARCKEIIKEHANNQPIQRIPTRTTEPRLEKLNFSMKSIAWCYMDKAFPDMENERAMSSIIGAYLAYSNEGPKDEFYEESVEVQKNNDQSTLDAMNKVFG
mgnify:CR=1 FL=1